MGADGGSIAGRSDMVRVRAKQGATSESSAASNHARSTLCRMSGKPLRIGKGEVVADALGRLYNREEVLLHLAERGKDSTGPISHIKRLSDVIVLNLTSSETSFRMSNGVAPSESAARFMCPLTAKPLNGKSRFIYLTTCGCVMSESGLKATIGEGKARKQAGLKRKADAKSSTASPDVVAVSTSTSDVEDVETSSCPVCGKAFAQKASQAQSRESDQSAQTIASIIGNSVPDGDVVLVNPTEQEETIMLARLEKRLAMEAEEKAKRKASKRAQADDVPKVERAVHHDGTADKHSQKEARRAAKLAALTEAALPLTDAIEPDSKRARLSANGSRAEEASRPAAATSAAAAIARLAKEAALKRAQGEGMSEAMKQVYGIGQERKKVQGSDWMTKGTFNRFA